jgi:hypothetical protein
MAKGSLSGAASRRLRIDEVQDILKIKRRCIYYHARKWGWQRDRGLFAKDDVLRLQAHLSAYHNQSNLDTEGGLNER